jgi:hypothetical protein
VPLLYFRLRERAAVRLQAKWRVGGISSAILKTATFPEVGTILSVAVQQTTTGRPLPPCPTPDKPVLGNRGRRRSIAWIRASRLIERADSFAVSGNVGCRTPPRARCLAITQVSSSLVNGFIKLRTTQIAGKNSDGHRISRARTDVADEHIVRNWRKRPRSGPAGRFPPGLEVGRVGPQRPKW